jgi:pimeloyl-ACP methyl ester carboxylesterase
VAFVEAAGHRLEVDRIEGRSPTLVFLHEGLGCVARWRDFPRAVAAATGRAALVYSRRGYGLSDPVPCLDGAASGPKPRPRPLDFMQDEAIRVLPALLERAGVEDAVLVGHSDGASIALVHAGSVGRGVRGLVAMAPHVFVEDVCVRSIAALRAEYERPETEVKHKLARHHADVDGAFYGWADAWLDPEFRRWDITGFLPGVRAPVLVIQGEDDEYGTIAQVDAVCAGVSGPAERLVLPGCGHVPQRDRREETLAAIVGFVGRVT